MRNPRRKALAVAKAVALCALAGCGDAGPKECTVETEEATCGQTNGTPIKRGDGTYAGCCCFSSPAYANEACCLHNGGSWAPGNGCAIPGPFVPPSMNA